MDRRIFGLENEYGVTCTFRGQRRLSPDEVARYLFRRVVSWGRSSNVFLRNGARLYLDVGSHPEYATPECDNVTELVTHDKAGERILEGLLVDAERRLHEEGIAGDVYLFKNNTDSAGNSYGCHENYLVARHGEFSRLADILIPFLVTRQLLCGAGKVLQTPRGAVYCVSQRAEHIWEGVSSATTRSRPIINTRDEPHADAERYRRLHVIVGDSNMSETTMLLKVGATDLVLRMIEAGTVMRDLTQHHRLLPTDRPEIAVYSAGTAPHRRGTEVTLATEARLGGELVWESRSAYLSRHTRSTDAPGAPPVPRTPLPPTAV
ncbi:proteasome accessory factor PafA2 family protein, partial [Streptomyces sp. NPDC005180]|uniref:proteasome accessory factor PafA2 family protein n=1 Tax=Streptomyces sp. NPDC005180 TaxID=3156868 RepID=UPI0033A7F8A9